MVTSTWQLAIDQGPTALHRKPSICATGKVGNSVPHGGQTPIYTSLFVCSEINLYFDRT